jgi:hypothetical protein
MRKWELPVPRLPPVDRREAPHFSKIFKTVPLFQIFSKRLSERAWEIFLDLPPVGWAGGRRPHASRRLIGREAPIFQKFSKRYPFFKFIFYPFLKKTRKEQVLLACLVLPGPTFYPTSLCEHGGGELFKGGPVGCRFA